MSAPLNYTTTIPSSRTLAEIQDLLGQHGADAIGVTYVDRKPAGVQFAFHGNGFKLPVDVDAMQAVLEKAERDGAFRASRKARGTYSSRDQAERVAWRVVKDWLEAQLALIAAHMAKLDEVMLPYLIVDDGRTLREQWRERLALPA